MSDEYGLQRDFAASARLNLQHFLMKDALGYLLHPSVPIHADMKIADVATGTGIWALDVSRTLPSTVSIDCFDISAAQYPSASILPPNIRFDTFDASVGVPAHLVGQYDVVHVSYLIIVVKNGDPTSWIRNLMRMLKPGGFLMWMEGNAPALLERSAKSPMDKTKYPYLADFEAELADDAEDFAKPFRWTADLARYFGECGLENVESQYKEVDKVLWRAATDNTLLIHSERLRKAGDAAAIAQIEGFQEDIAHGAIYPGLMPIVVVGSKPF